MYRASSQKDASVEDYWNVLKGALLAVTGRSCGWTKACHKETWWWNDDISNSVHSISPTFCWGTTCGHRC